jgi:outer membrane immunogenic protein
MRKLLLSTVALSAALIAPAVGADLARPVLKAPPPAAAVYNWTGFYIGVNAGGAWGDADVTLSGPETHFLDSQSIAILTANGSPNLRPTGFTGGGQIGYNWQSNNFVFGVETDINYVGLKARTVSPIFDGPVAFFPAQVTTSDKTSWLYTLRGRLGVAANNWLFYGTGGLAVGDHEFAQDVHSSFLPGNAENAGSIEKTKAGWAAGGGIEVAFASNWSLKVEYLHVDLRSVGFSTSNTSEPSAVLDHSSNLRENIVRAGLNWKFGGPVFAAY